MKFQVASFGHAGFFRSPVGNINQTAHNVIEQARAQQAATVLKMVENAWIVNQVVRDQPACLEGIELKRGDDVMMVGIWQE